MTLEIAYIRETDLTMTYDYDQYFNVLLTFITLHCCVSLESGQTLTYHSTHWYVIKYLAFGVHSTRMNGSAQFDARPSYAAHLRRAFSIIVATFILLNASSINIGDCTRRTCAFRLVLVNFAYFRFMAHHCCITRILAPIVDARLF